MTCNEKRFLEYLSSSQVDFCRVISACKFLILVPGLCSLALYFLVLSPTRWLAMSIPSRLTGRRNAHAALDIFCEPLEYMHHEPGRYKLDFLSIFEIQTLVFRIMSVIAPLMLSYENMAMPLSFFDDVSKQRDMALQAFSS